MAGPNQHGPAPSRIPSLGSSLLSHITAENAYARPETADTWDQDYYESAAGSKPTGDAKTVTRSSGPVRIPLAELIHVVEGVAAGILISPTLYHRTYTWIRSAALSQELLMRFPMTDAYTFDEWVGVIESELDLEEHPLQLAKLALAIAFLRESGRNNHVISADDVSMAWSLIHHALAGIDWTDRDLTEPDQGFVAVTIYSVMNDSLGAHMRVKEMLQLHIWLPDPSRGHAELEPLTRQHFTQSWVLAGQQELGRYTADRPQDIRSSLALSKNMGYSVPANVPHINKVKHGDFHAVLCYFDSSRGFVDDANLSSPGIHRPLEPSISLPAKLLVRQIHNIRLWEENMVRGLQHSYKAEWEHALREYNTALSICKDMQALRITNIPRYRQEVIGKLGCANRRFGRYDQARELLEEASRGPAQDSLVNATEPNMFHIDILGELAVVYRLMGLLDKAQEAAESQYALAKQNNSETEMCRAVGNLGMINYQKFLQCRDRKLLECAIGQIEERVRLARHITATLRAQVPQRDEDRIKYAITHEAIGLARLSLCYAMHGDIRKACHSGKASLDVALSGDDSIVIAMSRFFYGRALLKNGQRDMAMEQFNPRETPCTPAMAFCREPSEEHRGYLQELLDIGVDMSRANTDGYTALDYAVFSGDSEAAKLVLEGLRSGFADMDDVIIERRLSLLHKESKLRKCYRELFQEKLRHAFQSRDKDGEGLGVLRQAYATALAEDEEKRELFEGFKVVPYPKFVHHQRIPHSRDSLAQEFMAGTEGTGNNEISFVIFFSYRWIYKGPGMSRPDDDANTQYKRMIDAVERFLSLHPTVGREKLGIWVDLACVDQDNSAPGVAALLINLAQCDAIISLVDNDYYSRAWCSVEVLMVRTLKRAYGLQMWYEQVAVQSADELGYVLRDAPMDVETVLSEKKLTYEEDRPKLQFLERQTMLLA